MKQQVPTALDQWPCVINAVPALCLLQEVALKQLFIMTDCSLMLQLRLPGPAACLIMICPPYWLLPSKGGCATTLCTDLPSATSAF